MEELTGLMLLKYRRTMNRKHLKSSFGDCKSRESLISTYLTEFTANCFNAFHLSARFKGYQKVYTKIKGYTFRRNPLFLWRAVLDSNQRPLASEANTLSS